MPGQLAAFCVVVLTVALSSAAAAIAQQSGGARPEVAPRAQDVTCVPTRVVACPKDGSLPRGGRVSIGGRGLGAVRWVLFAREASSGDDVRAAARLIDSTRIHARVPPKAVSGPLHVVTDLGIRLRARRQVEIVEGAPVQPLDAAPSSRFFFDGRRKPTFEFDLSAPSPVKVTIVREDRVAPVRSWDISGVMGRNAVNWDGSIEGAAAPSAHYRFDISPNGAAIRAASGSAGPTHFVFADHLFPIRGRHNLGYTRTNSFGGGRNHQGQDMFARCGTRLAAARGGTVKFSGFHQAAGNYVVVDGRDSDYDYVYMHLRRPPLVRTGERVFTGQALGEVGDTGNASGCHLHFELWSSPGWYAGGKAVDPLPLLRRWDRAS